MIQPLDTSTQISKLFSLRIRLNLPMIHSKYVTNYMHLTPDTYKSSPKRVKTLPRLFFSRISSNLKRRLCLFQPHPLQRFQGLSFPEVHNRGILKTPFHENRIFFRNANFLVYMVMKTASTTLEGLKPRKLF